MDHQIGISLSGGGMRGIAHIGVLKALSDHNIHPTIVAGTSAGSIIGAMYAAGKTPDEMLDFVKKTNLFKMFKPSFPFNGLSSIEYLFERLEQYIEKDSFEHLQKPLFVYTTNLNTGEEKRFSSGKLFDKIMASCSVPLLFKPIEIDGQLHTDGGLLNNLPAKDLSRHAKVVIGSNVTPIVDRTTRSLSSFLGVTTRLFEIIPNINARSQAKYCDVIIEPRSISDYNFFSMDQTEIIFEKGYEEALIQLPYIIKVLETKSIRI